MNYSVYDEDNLPVTVSEKQLEDALTKRGTELPVEIIVAMGVARQERFKPLLWEALYHDLKKARIGAIYSLINYSDAENIAKLREREQSIADGEIDNDYELSLLKATLIRLEKGTAGARKVFFSDTEEVHLAEKSDLLYVYSGNIRFCQDDVAFIIEALAAYVNKTKPWMKKMTHFEYEDVILISLESLMTVAEETSLLRQLPEDHYVRLSKTCLRILQMRIDSYAKELIAMFARELPPETAYTVLKPLIGKARGDVRKELNISLNILEKRAQEE